MADGPHENPEKRAAHTMILTLKHLRNLPVETRNGERLGRIVDAELDAESHVITTYIVHPSRIAQQLVRSELRVRPSQVVSITTERMVVEDAVRPAASERGRARPGLAKDVAPAIPAESN